MMLSQRTFALLLAMTPRLGGKTVTKVLVRNNILNREPEDFLRLSAEAMIEEYKLHPDAANKIVSDPSRALQKAKVLEARLLGLGVQLTTSNDAHYPRLIEEMDSSPPGILFLYGNQRLLESQTFCVLSSRDSSPAALDQIERLAEDGVLKGDVLVTGHDRIEYQRSAIVPLRWGAPRILCFDRGLFKVLGEDLKDEAFRAARLWRYEFDPQTDLAISPFRPEADFVGVNNQIRDRIVASLSKRLDFVHLSDSGNMRKYALNALKIGRQVRVSDRIVNYRELAAKGAEVIDA